MCLFLVPLQRLSLSFMSWAATCIADGCSLSLGISWFFQSTRDQTPSLFGLILLTFPLARFGTCFARMFPCVWQICNTKVSQSILSALERTSEIQTSIFACRTIIYATTVPKLLYDEVKLVCDDCKSGYVKRSCRIPIPQSLLEWQGGGSLILLCLLIASWNCAHCILFVLGHDFPWFSHLTRDECGVGSFFFCSLLGLESKLHSFESFWWSSFQTRVGHLSFTERVQVAAPDTRIEPTTSHEGGTNLSFCNPRRSCALWSHFIGALQVTRRTPTNDDWIERINGQTFASSFGCGAWASVTLEELFSDSCQEGQDFKRVYSTFSCHLERNIESSMPKLEGETGCQTFKVTVILTF